MFVYTIQPVVSCIQTFTRLSNPFDNRFDNRLYRVNGALGLVTVSSRVRVKIRVKVRVSVMVRVSIRTSWVVNFALFRCYRQVIYTCPALLNNRAHE